MWEVVCGGGGGAGGGGGGGRGGGGGGGRKGERERERENTHILHSHSHILMSVKAFAFVTLLPESHTGVTPMLRWLSPHLFCFSLTPAFINFAPTERRVKYAEAFAFSR